jgi:hypothetical protein
VVVDDLDVVRAVFVPRKADAPLAIDSNAVLPTPVADQSLEMIAGLSAPSRIRSRFPACLAMD